MSRERARLRQWAEAGLIAPERVREAMAVAGVSPDRYHWRRLLERLLLGNGGALCLAGVMFFFAANWEALGRFARFALIEGLIIAALVVYGRYGSRAFGQASLTAATVLVGVLLAFFGQTYQTGADTWQLFATWAALILPWALLSRQPGVWVVWLWVVNIAVPLYDRVHPLFGVPGLAVPLGEGVQWLLFLINFGALVVWEAVVRPDTGRAVPRHGPRLLAVQSGFLITLLALFAILEPGRRHPVDLLAYAVWAAGMIHVYRVRRPDLFMLAGVCLTLIGVSTVALAKWLFGGDDLWAFLWVGVWVIGSSAWAVRWLRQQQEAINHE